MSSNQKARIATVVVMAVVGAGVLWRQGAFERVRSAPTAEQTAAQPQDSIYQTLDAVREGNLQRYIDAHTGSMESSLLRVAAEVGEARLLQSLQSRNEQLKGIAIQEPERLSEREVKTRVEYIFSERNEVQIYFLEKAGERWKIARVDGPQRVETLSRYGARVD